MLVLQLPQGGPIPEKYYRQNTTLNGDNAKTIKLPKRSSHKIELPVDNEGSVINWTFRMNGHHLGYALLLKVGRERSCRLFDIPLREGPGREFPGAAEFKALWGVGTFFR